ncbi:hypothetical protein ID866_10886 [Astraeus odoratus]|nr:hypothetical protein ID866_10886 [Astraeus odoratus]
MRANKVMDNDVDLEELAQLTKNYSGAEIEGFVKSATSFALNRHVKVGTLAGISDDVENLRVNRDDFMKALDEIKPAYGVSEEEISEVVKNGIITFDAEIQEILQKGRLFANQVAKSDRTPRVSVLLHGLPGSGKTTLAATIAAKSDFPFIKIISPNRMVGFSEAQKVAAITKTFQDSYKSPLSVIVIDNIERLLDWTYLGSRFSNAVLQTLLVLIAQKPPKGRRLLVLATSSLGSHLVDLGFMEVFDTQIKVPPISHLRQLEVVLRDVDFYDGSVKSVIDSLPYPRSAAEAETTTTPLLVGIKKLLSIIEMARQEPEDAAIRFMQGLAGPDDEDRRSRQPNRSMSNHKPKGILKNAGPQQAPPQHLQWDEDNLAMTEIQKDSLMKITEPKTPYVRYNADTDEVEGEIPNLDLGACMGSPITYSPRSVSPASVVPSGPSSRRASLSSVGRNSSGRSGSVASNRSTSFSLPSQGRGRGEDCSSGEVSEEEEMDEETAAKHAAFVRARGRHYSNEAEAMKRAALLPDEDEESDADEKADEDAAGDDDRHEDSERNGEAAGQSQEHSLFNGINPPT